MSKLLRPEDKCSTARFNTKDYEVSLFTRYTLVSSVILTIKEIIKRLTYLCPLCEVSTESSRTKYVHSFWFKIVMETRKLFTLGLEL